jgi:carbon storage regulator CsrA
MKITVLDIQGAKVRLGFEVDPAVPVHRAEVWERICAERRTASPLEDAISAALGEI